MCVFGSIGGGGGSSPVPIYRSACEVIAVFPSPRAVCLFPTVINIRQMLDIIIECGIAMTLDAGVDGTRPELRNGAT